MDDPDALKRIKDLEKDQNKAAEKLEAINKEEKVSVSKKYKYHGYIKLYLSIILIFWILDYNNFSNKSGMLTQFLRTDFPSQQ